MYYIRTFILYSILGFFLETLFATIGNFQFESGILYGPWTPIYGIGMIFIIILSNYLFFNLHMPRFFETIIVFFTLTIFLTVLEHLGGILIENIFHVTFWDYSNSPYHLGKYICLKMSLVWGFGSIFLIYIVKPFLEKFVKNIPIYIIIPLYALFIMDIFFTFSTTIIN